MRKLVVQALAKTRAGVRRKMGDRSGPGRRDLRPGPARPAARPSAPPCRTRAAQIRNPQADRPGSVPGGGRAARRREPVQRPGRRAADRPRGRTCRGDQGVRAFARRSRGDSGAAPGLCRASAHDRRARRQRSLGHSQDSFKRIRIRRERPQIARQGGTGGSRRPTKSPSSAPTSKPGSQMPGAASAASKSS